MSGTIGSSLRANPHSLGTRLRLFLDTGWLSVACFFGLRPLSSLPEDLAAILICGRTRSCVCEW